MAELFSEVRLPQSVESMLQKICIEQCKPPADTSARKQLELLGEEVSLEILRKICTQKIRYSLSGFIRCLAKDYATAPTQQGIYHSPHKRSSDDCYSPVNSPSRLKLNIGGSTKGDPGEGGFGGLIRDERGMWLVGYYGKLGVCTSLEAELWAIYRGLAIAFEKGYKDLTIETDSSSAIELLKERSVVSSSVISLVDSSKFLMQRCGYIMQHVLREGNNSADGLAKLGANQAEPLVVLDEAPVEIRGLVIADMANMESIMTETRMMQAVREELASVERRAEEERAAHNATKMPAMEREVELEHRALESSTALATIQYSLP
ncbi:hypothetical protein CsSME_00022890 [Camellia sinensis var. sinensis]